nr:LAGLIDADG family homing endonuclease [Candidatus Njordarchaeota archaeon]
MTNSNGCSGVSDKTEHSPHRLVMKVDALSTEERAYLLGLFLTDGYMTRVKYSARVHFSLANNEVELAERVSSLLGRLGLHPNTKDYSGSRNYVVVRAYGVALLCYFPEKDRLASLDGSTLEKWLSCEGLYGELGVPFIAGLLDGDGYVSASYDRESIFPCVEVCWSFAQKKIGHLIDFIVRYIEGVNSQWYERPYEEGR